jgi:S-layer homology domain
MMASKVVLVASVVALLSVGAQAQEQSVPGAKSLPPGAVMPHFPSPQKAVQGAPSVPDTGNSLWHNVRVGGSEFVPDGLSVADYFNTWNPPSNLNWLSYFSSGATFAHAYAWVHVPGGSLLTYVELDGCDSNATNHMTLTAYDCSYAGSCSSTPLASVTSDGSGCNNWSTDISGYTMNNYDNEVLLDLQFTSLNSTNELAGAIVAFQYQVTPAPGSATFLDVPTSNPQFQFVEALVAAGVTAGCGGGNYCPNNPVTRGQMAVFISKALGLYWGGY